MKYVATLVLLLSIAPAQAQIAKITADTPEAGAQLGSSIVTSGEWLFAAATGQDTETVDAGAVYVFHFDGQGWTQQQVLTVESAAEDYFGLSLAVDGEYLLAGSALADKEGRVDAGAVYVFHWDGNAWVQQAELQAPDPEAEDRFGQQVALQGDLALVSAYREDDGGATDTGAAYLYRRDDETWNLEARLTAPNAGSDHHFGYAVALGNGVAFVGAARHTAHQGFVYVFEQQHGTWQLSETLQSTYDTARAFGRTLLWQNGRLFIGDALDVHQGATTGAIYVYEEVDGVWQEQARLESDIATGSDYFGDHMALAGPYLVASARTRSSSASAGRVYLFEEKESGWARVQELPRPDLQGNRHFYGSELAFNKGFLYVSANGDNEYEQGAGAVYVYTLPNSAPSAPQLVMPASGAMIDLSGDPAQSFSVSWNTATDPDGDPLTYTWQLSLTDDFAAPLLDLNSGSDTMLETNYGTIAGALTEAGVATGTAVTAYHRVVVSDGIAETPSAALQLELTRGMLTASEADGLPEHIVLHPAYPNPFNPQTTVRYTLPAPTHVRLVVYDVLGREVALLVEGAEQAGTHTAVFEAGHLPAGLYVLRLQTGAFSQTQRVMLVK